MTYPETLRAAWQAHLAPKPVAAPTVVSVFAGCGGSSLGYSMAGFRELLAVEWEAHAAATFQRNFPHVPMFHGDIANVTTSTLDLPTGELDVLDGSPPCQGFSTAGRRLIDDPRNQLFREYVRLLEMWQPRTFVMENVSGLVKGQMKAVYLEILATLRAAGYRVTARLVDCSLLGVPQKRIRLVFVGVRNDLNVGPVHPKPSTSRPLTVRDAVTDLPPQTGSPMTGKMARLSLHIRPGEDGSDALERAGKKPIYFGRARLRMDAPAKTLTKAAHRDLLHPCEQRSMSWRELARLQSFPDEFDWGSSTSQQISARIGNSVPPLMMRAVATTLRDSILTSEVRVS